MSYSLGCKAEGRQITYFETYSDYERHCNALLYALPLR